MTQHMVHVTFKFINFPGDDKPTFLAMLQACPRVGEHIRFTEPVHDINFTDRVHVVRNVIHTIMTRKSYDPYTIIVEVALVSDRK